eukprot:CAMPEP_0201593304 /NCGR_PEP_ID=MMETSP0190_2-20130828/190950_1 /ASSEMBLY_ACC=CAM_ASM_000263 /TAXON_ID=37353 /ORGANISM="Rosalina sp." /LENGTH=109 /DNA_ID=CAMNT_0048052443 /DNA_START=49 /DNA_END=378 /DNA_ORIENTATION=+
MADESQNETEQKVDIIADTAPEESNIIPNAIDPLQKLPVRRYLDQTIVPILLAGMTELVKERPIDPIEYLAHYLLKNNPNSQTNVQQPEDENELNEDAQKENDQQPQTK